MKVKVRCRKFECRKDTGIYLPELVAKNAIPRPSAGSVFPIHTCYENFLYIRVMKNFEKLND